MNAQPLLTRVLRSVELTAPSSVDIVSNVAHVVAQVLATLKRVRPSGSLSSPAKRSIARHVIRLATNLVRMFALRYSHT